MQLKVKLKGTSARLPEKANREDLGYDLYSAMDCLIKPGTQEAILTGIFLEFPAGWGAIIKDRSSMAKKRLYTSAGIIDEGYRGEIIVLLRNDGEEEYHVKTGHKIAQLVPTPVTNWEIVESGSISVTVRDVGGFGSTGV